MRKLEENAILAVVACAGYLACMRYLQLKSEIERPTKSRRLNSDLVCGATPMTSDFSEDLKEIAMAMKEIARAIERTRPDVWKPSDIFEALRKLGLEGTTLFEAVEWLHLRPNYTGIFFALPEDLRLQWLGEKLGWIMS
ncbi:hypothetical protein PIB30_029420 [Stylosanthes scabra]|uniref:Uncharacterized protein n=1 Tax=Stylosanthes scabra TaxID=79078 RepID=A0ABU6WDF1_9FABA|nr:hypothetical protein [Stylosanthes scabra]